MFDLLLQKGKMSYEEIVKIAQVTQQERAKPSLDHS